MARVLFRIALGGVAKLSLFEDVEHNAWDFAYSNPELYSWLLSYTRSSTGYVLPVSEQKKYCGLYLYSYPNSKDTLHTFIQQEKECYIILCRDMVSKPESFR